MSRWENAASVKKKKVEIGFPRERYAEKRNRTVAGAVRKGATLRPKKALQFFIVSTTYILD